MDTSFLKQSTINNYFILDSHPKGQKSQRGSEYEDIDFVSYSYSPSNNNKLSPGSAFLYRKPKKVFSLYGGGIIESISETDANGMRKAIISKGFKFVVPIEKGNPFLESFKWEKKEKPNPPGWKGFWANYGILRITEKDFWGLVENREVVPVVNTIQEQEDTLEENDYLKVIREKNKLEGKKHFNSKPVEINNKQKTTHYGTPRKRQVAQNALCNAEYHCEIDGNHNTFYKRNSDIPYLEPHHLVPLKYQSYYKYDLDIEENIVALCSTCHNQIHYGEGAEILLEKLFKERKTALERVGIYISFSDLLKMYELE